MHLAIVSAKDECSFETLTKDGALTLDSSANTYNERDVLQPRCWLSIKSIFEKAPGRPAVTIFTR